MAKGPLECGYRRRFLAPDMADSHRLRRVRSSRAIPVRDNHAHGVRRNAGVGETGLDGATQPIAVWPKVEYPGSFTRATRAKKFAQNISLARSRLALAFQHQRGRAFAKNRALPMRIERTKRVARQQTKPSIMQQRFRFDRGVMPDGDHSIRFAGAYRRGGFRHRHRAARALIGHATVCSFKIVTDAD